MKFGKRKKIVKVLFVFLIVCFVSSAVILSACNDYADENENDNSGNGSSQTVDGTKSEFENLSYGEHEKQKLDIYLPEKVNEMGKTVPFILLIHGGSWTGGDKNDFKYILPLINGNGYAAVLINYRLIDDGADYSDMLDDVNSAVGYLKHNGAKYMLRRNKFAVWGNSAGGHLALLYAYKIGDEGPIDVSLVVSMVGPADFTDPSYYAGSDEETDSKLQLVNALCGSSLTKSQALGGEFPNEIIDASPVSHITADYPPTLLAYGGKDPLVPYSNAERLYDKLNTARSGSQNCYLVKFPNSGHELNKDPDSLSEAQSILAQAVNAYLPL